jgi:hypothetical protein
MAPASGRSSVRNQRRERRPFGRKILPEPGHKAAYRVKLGVENGVHMQASSGALSGHAEANLETTRANIGSLKKRKKNPRAYFGGTESLTLLLTPAHMSTFLCVT